MTKVLLLTENVRLRDEFEKYAAVVSADLHCSTTIGSTRADLVFIDAALTQSESTDAVTGSLGCYVVHTGSAGPDVWKAAVRHGAQGIIAIPRDQQQVLDLIGQLRPARARIVVVQPAVGGAGASTFAAALAGRFAAESVTALVDLDLLGGGIDVLCGIEEQPGQRWAQVRSAESVRLEALPRSGHLYVLSAGLGPGSTEQRKPLVQPSGELIEQVVARLAGECEWLFIDATRGGWSGERQLTLSVVPATVRAALAVVSTDAGEHVVVRSGGGCSLEPKALAESLRMRLVATIPTDQRIVEHIERGLGADRIALGGYVRAVRESAELLKAELR